MHQRQETPPTKLMATKTLLLIDAPVFILETDDIVLTEIVTALHFDQHQIDNTRVHQTVLMTRTDKGGLVGIQHQFLLVVDHHCHPADNNPVLASVVMHLQGQRSFGFHYNSLDLEALAIFQRCVGTPRTVHGAVE